MNNHTFIIPVYKESPYLDECILSLKQQTIKSDIAITTSTPSGFLDDVSKKSQIPIIVNEECNGIGADWTFAYKRSKTKYVTLAHQDDVYLPEYTRLCLNLANRSKDALIVFTDYSELFGDALLHFNANLFIKRLLLTPFLFKKDIASQLIRRAILSFGSVISCPCVMYNKEKIGDFEFSSKFLVSLDWDAWLRLCQKKGSFVYLNQRLMYHRIHKASEASLQTDIDRRKEEDEKIFTKLWPRPIAKMLGSLYYFSSRFTRKKMR